MKDIELTSDAFQVFVREAPRHAEAWMGAAQALGAACALDAKTAAVAYIAVLSALRLVSGIPFHVTHAKSLGATREEISSAVLLGLPAAGICVTQSLTVALAAWDAAGAPVERG